MLLGKIEHCVRFTLQKKQRRQNVYLLHVFTVCVHLGNRIHVNARMAMAATTVGHVCTYFRQNLFLEQYEFVRSDICFGVVSRFISTLSIYALSKYRPCMCCEIFFKSEAHVQFCFIL